MIYRAIDKKNMNLMIYDFNVKYFSNAFIIRNLVVTVAEIFKNSAFGTRGAFGSKAGSD